MTTDSGAECSAELTQHSHGDGFFTVSKSDTDGGTELTVSLSAGIGRGDYHDVLELRVDGIEGTVRVPVVARVVSPVTAVPQTVFLNNKPEGSDLNATKILLVGRNQEIPLDLIRLVGDPPGIKIQKIEPISASRCRVYLSVSSGALSERDTTIFICCGPNEDPDGNDLVPIRLTRSS